MVKFEFDLDENSDEYKLINQARSLGEKEELSIENFCKNAAIDKAAKIVKG